MNIDQNNQKAKEIKIATLMNWVETGRNGRDTSGRVQGSVSPWLGWVGPMTGSVCVDVLGIVAALADLEFVSLFLELCTVNLSLKGFQ